MVVVVVVVVVNVDNIVLEVFVINGYILDNGIIIITVILFVVTIVIF